MLNRKQIGQALVLSGLTTKEILIKSGIPSESYQAIFDPKEGKDPGKLTSEVTYNKLAAVIGLQPGMRDYRRDAIIDLKIPKKRKARDEWFNVFTAVRAERLSSQLDMAIIRAKRGIFRRDEYQLLLFDTQINLRFVVTRMQKKDLADFQKICLPTNVRPVKLSYNEFNTIQQLVDNGVYRLSQFNILIGGRASSYTWAEVQAAAKEFGRTTDDLINLISDHVHSSMAGDSKTIGLSDNAAGSARPVALRPRLSVVSPLPRQTESDASIDRTGTEG